MRIFKAEDMHVITPLTDILYCRHTGPLELTVFHWKGLTGTHVTNQVRGQKTKN
jgi:hypothetical protein